MKTSLLTITFCFISFLTLACSCSGPSSFCETINMDFNEGITIIGGRKISQTNYTMDIEVIHVFQGEESRSKITVFGDNGALCLMYTSGFEIGEILILALHRNGNWEEVDEEEHNYKLSACGLYFLRCNASLNSFTGEYDGLFDCLNDNICICNKPGKSPFYPNPNNGILYSKIDQIDDFLEDVIYVYNISGQIVRKLKVSNALYANGILEINLFNLPAGIYIIKHNFAKNCREMDSTKIIVQ